MPKHATVKNGDLSFIKNVQTPPVIRGGGVCGLYPRTCERGVLRDGGCSVPGTGGALAESFEESECNGACGQTTACSEGDGLNTKETRW